MPALRTPHGKVTWYVETFYFERVPKHLRNLFFRLLKKWDSTQATLMLSFYDEDVLEMILKEAVEHRLQYPLKKKESPEEILKRITLSNP